MDKLERFRPPAVELTSEELDERELASVSDHLFENATAGLKSACRFGVAVAERMQDNSAAFWGAILGNEVRQNHTFHLESQALTALQANHIDAAKHLLKRDISFTSWTQGFNDADTQRLLRQLNDVEQAAKRRQFFER